MCQSNHETIWFMVLVILIRSSTHRKEQELNMYWVGDLLKV